MKTVFTNEPFQSNICNNNKPERKLRIMLRQVPQAHKLYLSMKMQRRSPCKHCLPECAHLTGKDHKTGQSCSVFRSV